MYEQTSMIAPPQVEAKPAARYYEINEDTARNAHYCVHMSDYQPGSATNGYRAAVDEAAALVEARKSKVSPYYHDKLDALLDRYARRLAQWTNDYNRNQASYPSQFISGAGNYNMKKHEKQMSREGTLWKEYDEIKAILNKIEAVGTGAVDLADPHAREMLTDQLQKLQAQLDRNAAELATLPKGHPTAADVEAVHEMNTAAESARLAREHAEQLERREKAIRTRNENRAFIEQTAAAHPIKDGAPVVTVEWSENGAFDDGMKFSVAAAEIIFKVLDEQNHNDQERGYDKTKFSIEYTDADGEPSTYEGRYDLGDNDGGLIAHIRSFGAFLRDKGNFGNGNPTDEDKETGAAIVAVADLLEQYTESGRVVSVMPAPWLEEYKRRKAEQAQQEQEQARQDFADILESVQMLTDEQLERAVFAISPTDKEKIDVARFFLQELHRRDEENALAVFRRWKRGENPEQPD